MKGAYVSIGGQAITPVDLDNIEINTEDKDMTKDKPKLTGLKKIYRLILNREGVVGFNYKIVRLDLDPSKETEDNYTQPDGNQHFKDGTVFEKAGEAINALSGKYQEYLAWRKDEMRNSKEFFDKAMQDAKDKYLDSKGREKSE